MNVTSLSCLQKDSLLIFRFSLKIAMPRLDYIYIHTYMQRLLTTKVGRSKKTIRNQCEVDDELAAAAFKLNEVINFGQYRCSLHYIYIYIYILGIMQFHYTY